MSFCRLSLCGSQLLSNHVPKLINFNLILRNMATLQVGQKLPDATLHEDTPANAVKLHDVCANKKVIIFGVPGAFTPGCSKTHLPGYVEKASELKSKGIDEIICVSVNDAFVMNAWGQNQNTEGKVRMLADPNLSFTKAAGLEKDIAPLGGLRCKRFSLVAENCVVKSLNVEPDGTGLSCSLAEHVKV